MSLTEAIEHVKRVLRSICSDFLLLKKGEWHVSCVAGLIVLAREMEKRGLKA